ncbi:hypothetical protein H6P81_011460 [Aristolochia fimbriata]|uniref:AB hydrolase-1 domain-containing protein n=1 Tax=Aristolochia fimbriata TaxID=158543 RepID=A0AAV7ETT3_ARIFI|nr:hypothetical protein H6P81_011460 [Aristolochia fimbriata]
MAKCFSFTMFRDKAYRQAFASAGLKSSTTDFGDGSTMHCWIPQNACESKPSLLLVHGFGANATWQWSEQLRPLLHANYNVYVPDLLFFGDSYTTRPERSVSFQAQCVMRLMESLGVERMSLIGVSYGGFVSYSLAAQFPAAVEKLVLCCAGVCLEGKDLEEGLFVVKDLDEAASILMPQTPDRLRQLMRLSFVRPARGVPSCFLADFIDVMCTEFVKEKRELIQSILKERSSTNLPKINQPTLIIWGEQDQIFPVELAYRLHRHLEGNSELVIIKNTGHAFNLEKPKEFCKHLKAFLVDQHLRSSKTD